MSVFPDELYPAPRSWAEPAYPKLIHFNKLPTGGHFAAWEQPTDFDADPSVKVVVFESANPDFFVAHLDVAKAVEKPGILDLWREFVLRLAGAPVVSIAKIRGRTRGIGNEFVLACDMRFASRQNALFGQPEVGVGLIPGGVRSNGSHV